ncbi:tetratricopeptide (TPR) repeat protein [Agromyces terreus]|uniref:Tetratricopeptide (TPR) repeat protein n=1 Tax=Agromyces terreus TaxID=424795 RepID=A0A9X2GZ68_9MICO|nr:capsular polysaccharide synthesis protein [Agromyces terreus]MCP2371317.1 tetratricopeptide (TPR) repeat protein [Agromyces terreus]
MRLTERFRALRARGRAKTAPEDSRSVEVIAEAPPYVPLRNLVPSPRFVDIELGEPGVPVVGNPMGVYVHAHSKARAVELEDGSFGIEVEGRGQNTDTHIAPGGREHHDNFAYGMRPGQTYTVIVRVNLEEPLTGRMSADRLSIRIGCRSRGKIDWALARSHKAPNHAGEYELSVTFTLPADASAAWICLQAGASQGGGKVVWSRLSVSESASAHKYFDGSTSGDELYSYTWEGAVNQSISARHLQQPLSESHAAELVSLYVEERDLQSARYVAGNLQRSQPEGLASQLAAAHLGRATGNADAEEQYRGVAAQMSDVTGLAVAWYWIGRARETRRDWRGARDSYRKAADAVPDSLEYRYRLGDALYRTGDTAESRAIILAAIKDDQSLPFDGEAALSIDPKTFRVRREVGLFLVSRMSEITRRSTLKTPKPLNDDALPIFVYWAQGFGEAPAIVQECLSQLRALHGARLHELTDQNIAAYVEPIPDVVRESSGRAHQSDMLRLALLEKYGGIWIDATCFVSEDLDEALSPLLNEFFCFRYGGPRISNWFLAARRGSYIVRAWFAAMSIWWEEEGYVPDYFLAHHVFEMLYWIDPDFRAAWERVVPRDSRPPHQLQFSMFDAYESETFDALLNLSFVHKLKYQFSDSAMSPESNIAYLLRRQLG